jgi:hypothetical protein
LMLFNKMAKTISVGACTVTFVDKRKVSGKSPVDSTESES